MIHDFSHNRKRRHRSPPRPSRTVLAADSNLPLFLSAREGQRGKEGQPEAEVRKPQPGAGQSSHGAKPPDKLTTAELGRVSPPSLLFFSGLCFVHVSSRRSPSSASKTASESEPGHRVDLSVAAQATSSELQKRKSKWVMVQAFRPNAVSRRPIAVRAVP